MQNRKCFILVKDDKKKVINEYLINYNKNKVFDYTNKLVNEENEDLLIKQALERTYIGDYSQPKGVLSISKITFLTSYINRDSGKSLTNASNFNRDYDSFLTKEEKKKIIVDFLNLLEFVLVNSYSLDFFDQALDIFANISTPGISQAYTGCEKIINISEKTKKFFDTLDYDIEEHAKVIKKI